MPCFRFSQYNHGCRLKEENVNVKLNETLIKSVTQHKKDKYEDNNETSGTNRKYKNEEYITVHVS